MYNVCLYRVIGLHLYDGLFKVIPIDPKGQLREAYNIRYYKRYLNNKK